MTDEAPPPSPDAGTRRGVDLVRAELVRVAMPLVRPFVTSFGRQEARDVLLVHVGVVDRDTGEEAEGWGECVAVERPLYSSEWTSGAALVLRDVLLPVATVRPFTGVVHDPPWERFSGHHMAKAALETALLDAFLRVEGTALVTHLADDGIAPQDRDPVPCGVSIGVPDGGVPVLLDEIEQHLDEGYQRIKVKIRPGFDDEPLEAVRRRFGDDLRLWADANAAYELWRDEGRLVGLDRFGLELLEQPLGARRLADHARLARRMSTPLCLDESVEDVDDARDALAQGACRSINLKVGRLGGYAATSRVAQVAREADADVWCGGMLETGIGRAANLALASALECTLPGDTSASRRYFRRDLTRPFELSADGTIPVPTGPGLGVEPLPEVLREATTSREQVPL